MPLQNIQSSSVSSSSQGIALRSQDVTLQGPSGETITIHAELAVTPAEQEIGLMHRTALDPSAGMLFIFPESRVLSFWMKNTLIPLDVIFFDADGKFVSVSTMEPCTADPCMTYASAGSAMYALEVNKGFAEENKVGEGWRIVVKE